MPRLSPPDRLHGDLDRLHGLGPGPQLQLRSRREIDIVLDGRIDLVKGGRIRNTFEVVPDAPVSSFDLELEGAGKGLLVNSTDLCKAKNRATVKLKAQNGKVSNTEPVVTNSCGGKSKKHRAHRRSHR